MLQISDTINRFLLILVLFYSPYIIDHSDALVTHNNNNNSDLSQSAFCYKNTDVFQKYFPMHYPEAHLPWVWDAVYDPIEKIVEISTISRRNCYFNQTIWNRLLTLFPRYAKHLGGGLISNILVPADFHDRFDYTGKRNHSQGIQKKTVLCNFYNKDKLVHKSKSRKIIVDPSFLDNCPIQIKCPVTIDKHNKVTGLVNWDSMRIERDPKLFISEGINLVDKETESFPVCNLPNYQPKNKQYDLSICAYMFESRTETLVEWLEYHIFVGVDHFFIYSTATQLQKRKQLEKQLYSYIKSGIVTLVSWPYMNCVREWGTGRYIYFFEPSPNGKIDKDEIYSLKRSFKPPKKIMQSSAIASCYSRFKHTSKYMAQIDIDEYLITDTSSSVFRKNDNYNSLSAKNSFKQFVQLMFNNYPKAPGIAIRPVMMDECLKRYYKTTYNSFQIHNNSGIFSIVDSDLNNTNSYVLPRLGKWQHGRRGIVFESKLIIRTEAVDNVYVHYITQVSSNKWDSENVINVYLRNAALIHFKNKGGIIGGVLNPHDIRSEEEIELAAIENICRDSNSKQMTLEKTTKITNVLKFFNKKNDKLDYTKHGLSYSDIQQLFKLYIERMNLINRDLYK